LTPSEREIIAGVSAVHKKGPQLSLWAQFGRNHSSSTTVAIVQSERPRLGCVSAIEFTQLAAHDFACRGLWQIGNKLDQLRHLVSSKLLATESEDTFNIAGCTRL
jgi:hypothetical protein